MLVFLSGVRYLSAGRVQKPELLELWTVVPLIKLASQGLIHTTIFTK